MIYRSVRFARKFLLMIHWREALRRITQLSILAWPLKNVTRDTNITKDTNVTKDTKACF